MKKLLIKLIPAAMFAAALSLSSCKPEPQQEEETKPVFPETQSEFVEPGKDVVISFNANMDWTVSIPTDTKDFRIIDGGQEVFTAKGKSGDVNITVKCTAKEQDFDNHTVVLSLKMGNETKEIATVTLPSKERTTSVKTADTNEDGTFVPGTDGKFDYSYTGADLEDNAKITLKWLDDQKKYQAYILIDANYDWKISKNPEGVEVAGGKTFGTATEYSLSVASPNFKEEVTTSFTIQAADDETATKTYSVVIPTFEMIFSVYPVVIEDGSFAYPDDADDPFYQKYSETALADNAKITLEWPEDKMGFSYYLLVESNLDCEMAQPSWLTMTNQTTEGIKKEYYLRVDEENYELEQKSSFITFSYGEDFSRKYEIILPGCKDIVRTDLAANIEFNAEGWFKDANSGEYLDLGETGHIRSVTSSKVVIFKFAKEGEWYYNDDSKTEWMNCSFERLSDAAFAETSITIKVAQNTAETAREGFIMAVPEHITTADNFTADDLLNEGTAVKAEYEKYVLTTVSQLGAAVETEPIEPVDPDVWKMDMGEFKTLAEEDGMDYYDLYAWFECNYFYRIIYGGEASEGTVLGQYNEIIVNRENFTYKFFTYSSTDETVEVTNPDDFWVVFKKAEFGKNRYNVSMEPTKCQTATKKAALVFYDETGKEFAAVLCRYDPTYFSGGGDEGEVAFYDASMAQMAGSTLVKLAADDPLSIEYGSGSGEPVYHLTYTNEYAHTMSVVTGLPEGIKAPMGAEWLTIESADELGMTGGYLIRMDSTLAFADLAPEDPQKVTARIQCFDAMYNVVLTLVCTLDLTAQQ